MSDEKISQLASKIAKAGQGIGGKLKADSKNKEQNYDYISADKVLSVCGQALFDSGVAVLPSVVKHDLITVDRGNSKYRYDCLIDMDMTVTDGTDTIHCLWAGMGSDYAAPDKALYKAITSGHKYFLMKLLSIGEGNEDSEHEPEERPAQQPKHAQPKANGNGNGSKPAQQSEPSNESPMPEEPPDETMFLTGKALGSKMSLETAKTVTNSEGEKYGDLPTAKLANILNGIGKALQKSDVTPERRDELLYKRDAAQTIINARQAEQN